MNQSAFKRIVWAVDAFEEPANQTRLVLALGALARAQECEIYPIFVLSPGNSHLPAAAFRDVKEAFTTLAESRFNAFLKTCDLPQLRPLEVVINPKGSIRRDVEVLIECAQATSADLVVLATHARRGLERLFIGSFAESLALYSPLPILTVNPNGQVRERIGKVLFPTNFAPRYRATFERVVALTKTWEAQLVLFYQEPLIERPLINPQIEEYIAKETLWRHEMAREWQQWAIRQGARAEVVLEEDAAYLVPALSALAKKSNIDLVVMSTDATAVGAVLMGSSTRQALRECPCPVLVLRLDKAATEDF